MDSKKAYHERSAALITLPGERYWCRFHGEAASGLGLQRPDKGCFKRVLFWFLLWLVFFLFPLPFGDVHDL